MVLCGWFVGCCDCGVVCIHGDVFDRYYCCYLVIWFDYDLIIWFDWSCLLVWFVLFCWVVWCLFVLLWFDCSGFLLHDIVIAFVVGVLVG